MKYKKVNSIDIDEINSGLYYVNINDFTEESTLVGLLNKVKRIFNLF